ncbi:hypothetical protein [Robertkochia sediminum]|uniref:hypothetical protein n=1 Tax=Robertkochia sediminum TaxID=2785326 RepID=UPI00193434D0|nr:hypothetical protein [Robertkochia sediminum]MBL7471204.1 hypothetical protein [Robertkochia sediminum]
MTIKHHISILIFALVSLIGCKSTAPKKKILVQKNFGTHYPSDHLRGVDIHPENYATWSDILRRVLSVACQDSIPKVTFETDKEKKVVYFDNYCPEAYLCVLVKQKNILIMHNDSISKGGGKFYTIDSLAPFLKRDIENKGKDPLWSDHPNKLTIYLSYDDNSFENFESTLDTLTKTYEKLTERTDINILLDVKKELSPPPPPPSGMKN